MKKFLTFAAFSLAVCSAQAQEPPLSVTFKESSDKYKVETNPFWNNWFVTAGGGAQMYFGDHNRQLPFGKQISPTLDLGVGKWFTPGIGVRLMYSGLSIKGVTQNGSHSTGTVYDAGMRLDYQEFNFGNAHVDMMFNLTNLFCGYKADRVYTITPYVGLGWMFTWERPRQQDLSANLGVLNTFRLSPALDLNVDVRGAMVDDSFDGEIGGEKREGLLSLSVGLTYKFKQRGWNRSKTKTVVYRNKEEQNAMRDHLNQMKMQLQEQTDENNRLKTELAGIPETSPTKVQIPNQIVFFKLGKSKLTKEARVNLGFLADIMNENPKMKYVITGYADNSTGSKGVNDMLAESRVQSVYDCLTTEFNVPEERLIMRNMGGVENMFYNDVTLSRAVITEAQEAE